MLRPLGLLQMPLPCLVIFTRLRWPRAWPLSLCWLCLVAAPAGAAAPATPGMQERVAQCLQLRRNDPGKALDLAAALLKTPGLPPEEEIKALSCQGMAASVLGQDALAVSTAARMEQRMQAHPSLPAEIKLRAHSQAGQFFHSAGQIHRAEAAYLKANDLAAGLGKKDAAMTRLATLTNIGLIHADYLDSPGVADRYYRDAITAGAVIGYEDPVLYYNHATNLARLGRADEALKTLDRGEVVARQQDNRLVLQRLRSERAGIWIGQHRLTRARAVLQDVLAAQRHLGDNGGEGLTLAKLSHLQRQAGDPATALDSARTGWQRVANAQAPQEQREVLLAWMASLAALGQAEQALAIGRQLHELETRAMKQQRLDLLADLQARSQNAAAQRELERLRHETQIRRLADERSRLIRNGAIGLLTLLVLAAAALALLQRRKNRQLRDISATDPLTGLKNRRAATHVLATMSQPPCVPGTRNVLLLIDIDHFKAVNDSLGHHAGDTVLVELARRLRQACRPGDLVARWGGEEFMVACADMSASKACELAIRLHQSLGVSLELEAGRPWPLTVSIGFAPFPFFQVDTSGESTDWGYALRMADRALYAAKDHRNAWAGFWGQALPENLSALDVLEQPQSAVRTGAIDVMSSHTVAGTRR